MPSISSTPLKFTKAHRRVLKEAKEESKSQGRVQLAVALCLGGVAGLLLL